MDHGVLAAAEDTTQGIGLSFFDGIGALWILLQKLSPEEVGKNRWLSQHSWETDDLALAVLKHRHPNLIHHGGIESLC